MDVWKMSITYDGCDWIVRVETGPGAHSIGLDSYKTRGFVEGPSDDMIDHRALNALSDALFEHVLEFKDRVALELLAKAVVETDPLF